MMKDKTNFHYSSLLKVLPQIATSIGALTGIGLLLGWRELSSYYTTLGAPWVISILSPARFMTQSASLLYTFGFTIFISIILLLQKEMTGKGFRYLSVIFLAISAILIFFGAFNLDFFQLKIRHFFLDMSAACLAISAGLTIGEIMAHIQKNEGKWDGHTLMLMLFFVLAFGIYQASNSLGRSKALLDIETKFSSMPIIKTTPLYSSRNWRLVTPIEDNFLAISFSENDKHSIFKIFNNNEIIEIQTPD